MDLQNYPVTFKQKQILIDSSENVYGGILYPNTNPSVETHTGLHMPYNRGQPATNFFGVKAIRPPPNDIGKYKMPHPWNPDEHGIKCLKSPPVVPIYNNSCG